MFDLDLGKLVLVGAVALVVIGPKDLPAAMRVAGRVVAQLRRVRSEIGKTATTLMADASLDHEIAMLNNAARLNLARNPATAMRGSLPAHGHARAEPEGLEYATPEMQAYLAPPPETAPPAECLEATAGA